MQTDILVTKYNLQYPKQIYIIVKKKYVNPYSFP